MEAHHPKVWSRPEERARISRRQFRDAWGGKEKPASEKDLPPVRTSRGVRYFAARCLIRYAQEARLSGDEARVTELVTAAREMRQVARETVGPVW
jgi:hypothetical protein